MRGFRKGGFIGAVGVGAMLAGILSFTGGGLPGFFNQRAIIPSFERKPGKKRKNKLRGTSVKRGWTPNYYGVAGPQSREAERRRRQIAAGQLKRENGLAA